MNPLLQRQLRKHLPDHLVGCSELQDLFASIDTTYKEFQQNQAFVERTLDVISDELTEANQKLSRDTESRLAELNQYYQQTLQLQQGMILCFEQRGDEFVHTLCSGQLSIRLGWRSKDVVGHRLVDFLSPHQAETLGKAYATAWTGYECQIEFTSRDDFLSCLASLRPRYEDGRVREVIVSCVEITELKQAQAEAQKLALVAARTDNAVVLTNANGYIEWVNEGFTRITGYSFDDVLGRKPGNFLQGPETDAGTIREMREHLRRGEAFRTEVVNYSKDRRKYWLSIEVQPIHDAHGRLSHFMAIESDITVRRQTDESLRVQFGLAQALAGTPSLGEARYGLLRAIGQNMGWRLGLLWMVDPVSDTITCTDHWPDENTPAPDLVEFSKSLKLPHAGGLPGRVWNTAAIEWQPDLSLDPACPRATLALKNKLRCSVGIPIRAGGDVLGVAEFLSDKSEEPDEARLLTFTALGTQIGQFFERIHAEDSLRRRGEELLQVNNELARASKLKDVFLASMSHELRTPLNSILGLSESLAACIHGPLNEKQSRYIDLVVTSGRHLLSLINDILDLAKIESGQQTLQCEPCSLSDLCRSAIQMVSPMAAKRHQHLACELNSPSLVLNVDSRRIKQILVNLLGNAVKFTPESGKLGLRVIQTPDELRFEIWDHGIGIAQEELSQLFTPFRQIDNRLSREYAGTGLGLSLVKQLTALHRGRVEVSSVLGQGSVFSAILPASVIISAADSHPSAKAKAAYVPLTASGSTLILIAEDNPLNLVAIKDYLEAKGYLVEIAENGRIAIDKTLALRPALILMDVQMPVLDGLEAIRVIRAFSDPALAATPIIAVTALAMTHDRELCLTAGANDYMAKPCSPRELCQRVAALLAPRPPNPADPEKVDPWQSPHSA